jgi:hypothetical protein
LGSNVQCHVFTLSVNTCVHRDLIPEFTSFEAKFKLIFLDATIILTATLYYQQHYINSNIILSATLYYQQHYIISNIILTATLYYQQHFIMSNIILSATLYYQQHNCTLQFNFIFNTIFSITLILRITTFNHGNSNLIIRCICNM